MNHSRRWIAVVALGALMPVVASFAVPDSRRSARPQAPVEQGATPRADDGAPQGPPGEGRRGGMRRELTDRDLERLIATARDVDPAWADGLEALRQQDPAKLRQRIGSQARMLIGLSMLRERQPELYQARVEDFRVQREIRGAVERLRAAREAGDAAAEEVVRTELRGAIDRQFELDVKSRAYELVAMERALKDARKRLQADIAERAARITEAVETAERGEMPRFGRGPEGEGPWMWREREGGRAPGDRPGGDRAAPPPPADPVP
jgi:hypothetical protein